MSERQYRVARNGIFDQFKIVQRLIGSYAK